MEKAKQEIEKAKIELGIKYVKVTMDNIQLSKIKKIVEKNPDYSLSNAELLDEELEKVYQYYGEYEAIVNEGNVMIDGVVIGKVKEGNKKKLEGVTLECTITGGNYKTISYKDEEPNKIVLHHSDIYKVTLERKINA